MSLSVIVKFRRVHALHITFLRLSTLSLNLFVLFEVLSYIWNYPFWFYLILITGVTTSLFFVLFSISLKTERILCLRVTSVVIILAGLTTYMVVGKNKIVATHLPEGTVLFYINIIPFATLLLLIMVLSVIVVFETFYKIAYAFQGTKYHTMVNFLILSFALSLGLVLLFAVYIFLLPSALNITLSLLHVIWSLPITIAFTIVIWKQKHMFCVLLFKIDKLLVFKDKAPIFSYDFSKRKELNDALISDIIFAAIKTFPEITSSSEQLQQIETEEYIILFEHRSNFYFALIARKITRLVVDSFRFFIRAFIETYLRYSKKSLPERINDHETNYEEPDKKFQEVVRKAFPYYKCIAE